VSVTSVLVPLTGYIDRFLVGALASVSAVAFYAAPYELASKLLIVPGSISAVLLPSLSQAFRLRDSENARTQATNSFVWSCCALFGAAALLIVLARPLLALWLGPAYEATSTMVFQFLLIGVYLNGLALIPFTMLESAGRPDVITKYHLIELPIYLAITIPLIQRMGIEGAALAWVARNIACFAVLLRLAGHVRAASLSSLIGRGSAAMAGAGGVLLAASVLALQAGIPEWVLLLLNGAALLSAVRWLRGFDFATATSSPAA
jgi:O-antigen/teichoic acid export membrane protein